MTTDGELVEQIASDIFGKLAFTNGWRIDEDKYEKLCDELAKQIIHAVLDEVKPVVLDALKNNTSVTIWESPNTGGKPAGSTNMRYAINTDGVENAIDNLKDKDK